MWRLRTHHLMIERLHLRRTSTKFMLTHVQVKPLCITTITQQKVDSRPVYGTPHTVYNSHPSTLTELDVPPTIKVKSLNRI